jgi:hypothetical protein
MRYLVTMTSMLWVVAACEASEAPPDARELLDADEARDASAASDASGSEDALALDALAPDSPEPDAPGVPRDAGPSTEDGGPHDAAAAEDAATCAGTVCDGACVDTSGAVEHCGGCGNDCRTLPGVDVAAVACERGACVIAACLTRLADCDGAPENGCEVSLRSDDRNCGMCERVCSAPTDLCMNGECR